MKLKTMKIGDLFVYESFIPDFNLSITSLGICLKPYGYNSRNQKLYKVYLEGKIKIISEAEIKNIYS